MTLIRSPSTTRTSLATATSASRSTAPWRSLITVTRIGRILLDPRRRRQPAARVRFGGHGGRGGALRLRPHARRLPADGGGPPLRVRADPRPHRSGPVHRGAGGRPPDRPRGGRGGPPGGGLLRGPAPRGARPRGGV